MRQKTLFAVIFKPVINSISFLTILHFTGRKEAKIEGKEENIKNIQDSIKFFPFAGLFIGAALAAVFFIFNMFLIVPLCVLLSLISLFILTGGLHFDGLADTVDGLFAYLKSRDKNRFYKAMKDVNTGFAGSAAMLFYLLIMLISIIGVDVRFAYLSLFTFPVIGRYSIVLMSYFLKTPDEFKGIGTVFTEGTSLSSFILASILSVIIVYLFLNLAGIFSLMISIFFILMIGLYFSRKFGGVSGDMLGFGVKISEIIYMIALSGFYKILIRV